MALLKIMAVVKEMIVQSLFSKDIWKRFFIIIIMNSVILMGQLIRKHENVMLDGLQINYLFSFYHYHKGKPAALCLKGNYCIMTMLFCCQYNWSGIRFKKILN